MVSKKVFILTISGIISFFIILSLFIFPVITIKHANCDLPPGSQFECPLVRQYEFYNIFINLLLATTLSFLFLTLINKHFKRRLK